MNDISPQPIPPPETAARLAEELRVAISRLNRRLREEGNFGDFSFSQSKVLIRLERHGPATVTALAEAEGMRPQSMSGIISELKAAGMVEGARDPEDGRQTVLWVTEKCRETVAAARCRETRLAVSCPAAKIDSGRATAARGRHPPPQPPDRPLIH